MDKILFIPPLITLIIFSIIWMFIQDREHKEAEQKKDINVKMKENLLKLKSEARAVGDTESEKDIEEMIERIGGK